MTTSLDKLDNLVSIIDKFVNGQSTESIVTTQGKLPTLSGINQKALDSGFIQKLIEYDTYANALADASLNKFKDKQLISVNNNGVYNGIYEVNNTTLTRKQYTDSFSLIKQDTYSIKVIDKTATDLYTSGSEVVYRWSLLNSNTSTFYKSLDITIDAITKKTSAAGMVSAKYKVMLAYTNGVLTSDVSLVSSNRLPIDTAFTTDIPKVTVSKLAFTDYTDILIKLEWAGVQTGELANISVSLFGLKDGYI